MSIIARLAGYSEYVNNSFKSYAAEVDTYFAPYKQHPAVRLAVQIRADRDVSFDAVMSMAVHLKPPPALTPRVPFTDSAPDPRWARAGADAFAPLLQQFYRDANCEQFFRSHATMFKTAEARFQTVLNKVDFDWYGTFYGEVPAGSFNLYLGLLNGGGNYGPKVIHPDLSEDRYAIIGVGQVDNAGLPVFDDGALPTIIHEYNHAFINPLVHAAIVELRVAGETIFAPVAGKLKPLAYGDWQTALIESLVRAGVIRYQFDHGGGPLLQYKGGLSERNRGFLWIGDLLTLMGTYEHDRGAFPTFRSFFPLIVGYFNDLSTRIDADANRFDELSPKVVGVGPFANGAEDVDPHLTRITVKFDRPLDPKGGYSFGTGPGGAEQDPVDDVVGFDDAGTSFSVKVTLKPNREYDFVVTGLGFRTRDGYPLQTYTVRFKTRKD